MCKCGTLGQRGEAMLRWWLGVVGRNHGRWLITNDHFLTSHSPNKMPLSAEWAIKGTYSLLVRPVGSSKVPHPSLTVHAKTILYAMVTYRDTKDRSPLNNSLLEWDVCAPLAAWYISWHVAICLSVVSLPSRLFRLECGFFSSQNFKCLISFS
jgi:hypothetical protein